jgi:hypothetical protein
MKNIKNVCTLDNKYDLFIEREDDLYCGTLKLKDKDTIYNLGKVGVSYGAIAGVLDSSDFEKFYNIGCEFIDKEINKNETKTSK